MALFPIILLSLSSGIAAGASNSMPAYILPDSAGESGESRGILSRISPSIGASRYAFLVDADHAWNQHFASTMTVYRTGGGSRLIYFIEAELVADGSNPIHFSPNSIFYDNLLLFTQSTGPFRWGAGYLHRCQHHIDANTRVWLQDGPYFDLKAGSSQGSLSWAVGGYIHPFIYTEDQMTTSQARWIAGMNLSFAYKAKAFFECQPTLVAKQLNTISNFFIFSDAGSGWFNTVKLRTILKAGYKWNIGSAVVETNMIYQMTEDAGISTKENKAGLFSFGLSIMKI
jgi:hypothetical protein